MLPVIIRKKNIGDLVKKLYEKNSNAKYFGFYDFSKPVIIIRDVDLLKSVAVKNFENFTDHGLIGPETRDQLFIRNLFNLKGQEWHNIRTLLSPAFTSCKMKILYKLISNSAVNFVECLIRETKDDETSDMKEFFSRYTNDVIANCAFGITINTMENPKNDFYIFGKEATNLERLSQKIILMRNFPFLMKLLNVNLLRSKIDEFFNKTIRLTINIRDSLGISRPDILQLLMDSRGRNRKINLSMEAITAQAFVIYFGAFDTTSTTMAFLAHELALNPEIQIRLQDEIDAVFNESNGNISYDAINGLEYLEAVLYETARKYPVLATLDRVCTKEFQLPAAVPGAKSVSIKPGMLIWIPLVGYHYDPLYYEDPEKFNPDRFLNNSTASKKSTFLSFGIGPRQCVGSRFAMLEMKIVFFHFLARCNFRTCSKTTVPLKLSKRSLGLAAENGYWVKVELRKHKENSFK
ncbi:cytochrome P450 9e2-like [Leptopilina heterotoma]|uniref:cytochrome P450 9e2-like n=1 Tax=Leptopilina heterotoma TaxID=63436 RepID=UPI001CA8A2D6|nr:cytochrome P450 9e2-like [Leptopilina heterotoma]